MNKGKALVSQMDASTAIDAAQHLAGLIPTHRECSIEIINKCSNYTLTCSKSYVDSGFCAEVLPLTIDPTETGNGLFSKTANTARGSVGVFTYDLVNKSTKESTEKMAVMFSVPYDFNLYSNWFAVGIFDNSRECDYDLYSHMYNNTEETFKREKGGSTISYKKNLITIMASMPNSYQPQLKIEVSEN